MKKVRLIDQPIGTIFWFTEDQAHSAYILLDHTKNGKGYKVEEAYIQELYDTKNDFSSAYVYVCDQESRAEKLRKHVQDSVMLGDLQRLIDGDLAHIGDAILAGKRITHRAGYVPFEKLLFTDHEKHYKAIPDRITVGGVSFPKPETTEPGIGTHYFLTFPELSPANQFVIWDGDMADRDFLRSGMVHLNKADAEEHRKALIKLSGGEA